MSAILKEVEAQAMQLSAEERGILAHQLILSLEGMPEDTPEAIAKAWDVEIARRIADMEAGNTRWIPAEEVMAGIRAKIDAAKSNANKPQR